MDYRLSQQDMDTLQEFIDGKADDVLLSDVTDRLFRLTEAVRRTVSETARRNARKAASAERKLERIRTREDRAVEDEDFPCLLVDTLDLAYIIRYYAGKAGAFLPTETLMFILFDTYANWLYQNRQRLTVDHPECQEKGAWFWSIKGKIDYKKTDFSDVFGRVSAVDTGIPAMIRSLVDKYTKYRPEQIVEMIHRIPPYVKASPKNNGGKWNGILKDSEIFLWKRSIHQ